MELAPLRGTKAMMGSRLNLKKSSQIQGSSYDPESQILTLDLNNNTRYLYFGVSEKEAQDFEQADSHGDYFHAHIRNVKKFKKVK